MTTALSSGVKISVNCQYEEKFSRPENNLFLFSYEISIENKNPFPLQLLRRHWKIVDSSTDKREVEGEGVIGVQPIVKEGDVYSYRSSCDFMTDAGTMKGYYIMRNLINGEEFEAEIPEFMLMVPHKLN